MNPKILQVKKHAGIAGQFSVTAEVQYDGEPADTIEFVGSVYGGPVVMVTGRNGLRSTMAQTFVTDPDRFGTFGAEWVRRFFGASS